MRPNFTSGPFSPNLSYLPCTRKKTTCPFSPAALHAAACRLAESFPWALSMTRSSAQGQGTVAFAIGYRGGLPRGDGPGEGAAAAKAAAKAGAAAAGPLPSPQPQQLSGPSESLRSEGGGGKGEVDLVGGRDGVIKALAGGLEAGFAKASEAGASALAAPTSGSFGGGGGGGSGLRLRVDLKRPDVALLVEVRAAICVQI